MTCSAHYQLDYELEILIRVIVDEGTKLYFNLEKLRGGRDFFKKHTLLGFSLSIKQLDYEVEISIA